VTGMPRRFLVSNAWYILFELLCPSASFFIFTCS
jgi:hypothetical protein